MTDTSIHVVYIDHGGEGYHCVLHMARLAAELLGGKLVVISPNFLRNTEKLKGIFLPRPKSGSTCLLICPLPADLSGILLVPEWRQTFSRVVAWVFDSFWTQWIPPWARATRLFDHVFVTERDDLKTWRRMMHAPVDWLPWGSDVLNFGSANPLRSLDLVRFGRQPKEWEDDQVNAVDCKSAGLEFHGRPESLVDATDNQRGLMRILAKTKFALAFSNRVSPGPQTHPTREYITGRWTDALASGATVAGIAPQSESVRSLLWPEAMLDIGTVDRNEGLEVICAKAQAWTEGQAQLNHLKALEVLDWRLRFRVLAEAMLVSPPRLNLELTRLAQAISSAPAKSKTFSA